MIYWLHCCSKLLDLIHRWDGYCYYQAPTIVLGATNKIHQLQTSNLQTTHYYASSPNIQTPAVINKISREESYIAYIFLSLGAPVVEIVLADIQSNIPSDLLSSTSGYSFSDSYPRTPIREVLVQVILTDK